MTESRWERRIAGSILVSGFLALGSIWVVMQFHMLQLGGLLLENLSATILLYALRPEIVVGALTIVLAFTAMSLRLSAFVVQTWQDHHGC